LLRAIAVVGSFRAARKTERYPALVRELIELQVEVIVTWGSHRDEGRPKRSRRRSPS